VQDTGEAITEKILPKLFSKFSISNSTTETGLELFVCKNIIETHDGKTWPKITPIKMEQALALHCLLQNKYLSSNVKQAYF
jgi:K+-sensing histidine kinase KdpD